MIQPESKKLAQLQFATCSKILNFNLNDKFLQTQEHPPQVMPEEVSTSGEVTSPKDHVFHARMQLCAIYGCWTRSMLLAGWNDGTSGPLIPKMQEVYHASFLKFTRKIVHAGGLEYPLGREIAHAGGRVPESESKLRRFPFWALEKPPLFAAFTKPGLAL
ncbi:hypothetical protein K438DRAFT_1753248 [Mycena galopus ATCC 62051]|nr:hypothetical protein K438DRAFT_1753248 [Mycena galopus ATCC 62051]